MIDITTLWNRDHPHLHPMADSLPLAYEQLQTCEACGQPGAFKVLAHVRFGEDRWLEESEVIGCPQCRKWLMPEDQIPAEVDPQPTAVDARLWSRTPTVLNIEPTTRCNFNCWYCVGRHMEQKDVSIEDFKQVLDHFPSVRLIALVGEGEPLMHKGFFEMARIATDRGIRVVTLSNGSTLSTSNVQKICEAGIYYISVSIDSFDADTFASSRINGDLSQVLAGIKRLADYRDAHGFKYPRIGLKGSLFSHTQDQIPQIVALAQAHGVEIFESFQPLNTMQTYVPIYPVEKQKELEPERLDQVIAAIQHDSIHAIKQLKPVNQFCEEEGIVQSNIGKPNRLRPNCDEEWIYSLLSGDVTPCCQIKTPISQNWNLVQQSMDEILADHLYENTRFNLWNGLFPIACKGCYKTQATKKKPANKAQCLAEWAHTENKGEFLALFRRAFKSEMPENVWRWKYAGLNPFGTLARRNGRVVAFYGGIPRTVELFGSTVTAVQIGDVMVDPDERGVLRRHGPFYFAATHYLQHVGEGKHFPLAFGFPSRRAYQLGAHLGLYAKAGEIMRVDWTALNARFNLLLRTRLLDLSLAAHADQLWLEMAAALSRQIVGVRNYAFLKRRYLEHPTLNYRVYLVSHRLGNKPYGIIVVREEGDELFWVDMVAPPERVPALVSIVRRLASDSGKAKAYTWITAQHAALFAGESGVINPTEIVIPALDWNPAIRADQLHDRWWLMAGDTDFL